MTREEIKILLPVITAYAEGKEIELKDPDGNWKDTFSLSFCRSPENYRIKSEVKCRPFKNAEECWQEMRNHSPFGWVKFKNGESGYIHFETVRNDGIYFNSISTTFEESLDYYTFIDGSPFGVKEE